MGSTASEFWGTRHAGNCIAGATLNAALLVAVAGCIASEREAADGTWVGTITTEGNVTTVVNEAGSVWGGTAALVEEASIGVDAAADEYMLGAVAAVWGTDDSIYVLDWQVPVVRVFDLAGNHRLNIGHEGQGPGEFIYPVDLAITRTGEVLVIDRTLQVDTFGPDGDPRSTWQTPGPFEAGFGGVWVLGDDDVPWLPTIDREANRIGRVRLGPEGPVGPPTFPPILDWERGECLSYERDGRRRSYCDLPFRPVRIETITPSGGWTVGISDTYRYEIHASDGSILTVERQWEPVEVSIAERDHHEQRITEFIRQRDPSWTWSGPELPTAKPAYLRLIPDRNGRTWVLREQASRLSTECPEGATECWPAEGYWLEAFGADGRFLGSMTLDRLPTSPLFIDNDMVLAVVMDDAGTIMVKRYRLLVPGEEGR